MRTTKPEKGNPLKEWRLANNLNQEDAAKKLRVPRSTFAGWEAGHKAISTKLLPRVVRVTQASWGAVGNWLKRLYGDR